MPKKTQSQSIGEIGATAAMKAFVSAGWSVDAVHSDYGEDLIGQTFLEGEADPFRILIQVKASRKHRTIELKRDHLRKWLGSIDLVILVFWDVSKDEGFYFVPGHKWNLGDLFSDSTRFTIKKDDWQALSPSTICEIEWQSRLRGWNILFLDNKSKTLNVGDDDLSGETVSEIFKSLHDTNTYIIFKLLGYLDFVEVGPQGVLIKSINVVMLMFEIKAHLAKLTNSEELVSLGLNFEQSILLAILWKLAIVAPNAGIPGSLLEEAVRVMKILVKTQAAQAAATLSDGIDESHIEELFSI